MVDREIDEGLASLCRVELAAGEEGLLEGIASLSRDELERLLQVAVVELMDTRDGAAKDQARLARRVNDHRKRDQGG